MGNYLDEGDTPLLTNVREHADVAAGQGRDVYFTGEEGEESPEQDKNYKFAYYPKEGAPPGQKPSDDELDFFEKRKTFMSRAKEQLGFDPDALNPDEEAYRVANEALKNASPVVRLFGPQTPEDYRKLRNVFEAARKKAAEQKTYGRKVLGDLDSMFRKNYEEERKHQRTLEETAAKEAGKFPTQDAELTNMALHDPDPARRKQAQEVLDAMQVRKQTAQPGITEDAASLEGFRYLVSGKMPYIRSGKAQSEIANKKAEIAKQYGLTAQMIQRMQSDFTAMDKSVSNQRKNYDMMNGFVQNMDKQMERLDDIYKTLPRAGLRLLNIPMVELRKRALGSGEEASAAAILIELGNESGKLSTNSAASIRELSESAQEQWAKIHDGKLSYNDIKKVLATTKGIGHDRLTSTKYAMDMTLDAIEGLAPGGGGPPKPESGNQTKTPPANILKENIHTTFKNGQVWTLKNGQPVQVK